MSTIITTFDPQCTHVNDETILRLSIVVGPTRKTNTLLTTGRCCVTYHIGNSAFVVEVDDSPH